MENQRITYMIHDNSELGSVKISEGVLAMIAAIAATEVDGVTAISGGMTKDIISKLSMKKLARAIKVDVNDNEVTVDISVAIRLDVNVVEVSEKIQDKVKSNIENMTGMNVVNVNVNISSVDIEN